MWSWEEMCTNASANQLQRNTDFLGHQQPNVSFKDEEDTEAQREKVPCPRLNQWMKRDWCSFPGRESACFTGTYFLRKRKSGGRKAKEFLCQAHGNKCWFYHYLHSLWIWLPQQKHTSGRGTVLHIGVCFMWTLRQGTVWINQQSRPLSDCKLQKDRDYTCLCLLPSAVSSTELRIW